MALAVPPRNSLEHRVIYNVASRQEQTKFPDKTKFLRLFQKFYFGSRYRKIVFNLVIDRSRTEKNQEHDMMPISFEHPQKQKSHDPDVCWTVFFEDLPFPQGYKTLALKNKSFDESSINRYCRIAQLRLGVICVDFWQYSNVSVTAVKDEEDHQAPIPVPAPFHIQTKCFESRFSLLKEKGYKCFVSLSNLDKSLREMFRESQTIEKLPKKITLQELRKLTDLPRKVALRDLQRITHPQRKKTSQGIHKTTQLSPRKIKLQDCCKVIDLSKELTIEELSRLTELPRSKLRSAPVKIPPNSVTVITCPGKRRSARGGQRSRPRNQISQNTRERSSTALPIQVTDKSLVLLKTDLIVTSIQTIYSRTGNLLVITTNLMPTVELEEQLTARRRGTDRNRRRGVNVKPARYPDFRDVNKRQSSFETWPQNSIKNAAEMVKNGFFYTGRFDLVRCFQCGIGMKDWSEMDDPLFEHIRHSSECLFLLDLLGPELLSAYKVNLLPTGSQPATERLTAGSSAPSSTPGVITTQAEGSVENPGAHIVTTSRTITSRTPDTSVRSPQFSTMESRIRSFRQGWPSDHSQTPENLADAGFFYSGYGDICRCFTCDGGLQRWDPLDDPWIEHARWFPSCEYVLQSRGQEYVDLVQRAANNSSDDDDPAVEMRTQNATAAMGSSSLSDSDALATDAAKQVLEMGYSKKSVLLAIHELHVKAGNKELDVSSIIDVLQAKKDRGEALPTDSPPNEAAALEDPERENDPVYLKRENLRLKQILRCVKCEERDANMLFLPCTHHTMCEECAEDTLLCPVCGRDIEQKVKTYMS